MKVFAIVLLAVLGVSACGNHAEEKTQSITQGVTKVNEWNGEWGFAINGLPTSGFEEFKLVITDNTIVVWQGKTKLWDGSFNTSMPVDGRYIITSVRTPGADLPYISSDVKKLEFPYSHGVLKYVENRNLDALEFVKAD